MAKVILLDFVPFKNTRQRQLLIRLYYAKLDDEALKSCCIKVCISKKYMAGAKALKVTI